MTKETVTHNGRTFELYIFQNPMSHDDWHEAEAKDLVYVHYSHHSPDYWDDEIIFVEDRYKDDAADFYAGW